MTFSPKFISISVVDLWVVLCSDISLDFFQLNGSVLSNQLVVLTSLDMRLPSETFNQILDLKCTGSFSFAF